MTRHDYHLQQSANEMSHHYFRGAAEAHRREVEALHNAAHGIGRCEQFDMAVKYMQELEGKVAQLEQAIRKTLDENLHLADGEVCTLIELKRAVPDWRMPDA